MKLVDLGKGQWVDPHEVVAVEWSASQDCPRIALRHGGEVYAAGHALQYRARRTHEDFVLDRTAAVATLVGFLEGEANKAASLDVRMKLGYSPGGATGGPEPFIVHDRALGDMHPNTAAHRAACRVCVGSGSMGTGPAAPDSAGEDPHG